MPPRSVCLNVFTHARGLGKEADVRETVAEVAVERDFDVEGTMEDVRMSDRDGVEAQNFAAKAVLEVPTCAVCRVTSTATGTPLLRCSRCRLTFYCNTTCQKADWKSHKKSCGPRRTGSGSTPSSSPATPSTPSPSDYRPTDTTSNFLSTFGMDLDLHSLDQQSVFSYLIDAYRLRVTDNFKFIGTVQPHSLMTEEPNRMKDFQMFLDQAERSSGLLPRWWDSVKRSECEEFAQRDVSRSLQIHLEKNDVIERYGDPMIPVRLRLLAERVYGCAVASFS